MPETDFSDTQSPQSDASDDAPDAFDAVYAFVRTVPCGKVVTYGQVAACVSGVALTARQVGAAMNVAPPDVPWQRVVGAGGALPIAKRGPDYKDRQRNLLEAEGVAFVTGKNGGESRIDMNRHQWQDAVAPDPDAAIPGLFDGEA